MNQTNHRAFRGLAINIKHLTQRGKHMNDAPKPFSTAALQGSNSEPSTVSASVGQARIPLSIRRRMLLKVGAIAGSMGSACLSATSIVPESAPASLEQKMERTRGFVLIGVFTGVVKSINRLKVTNSVRSPAAIAAFKKYYASSPLTQEALEAYRRNFPYDPVVFAFQDRNDISPDCYDFLEFKLEKVAFVRGTPGQHMNMDAQHIYFFAAEIFAPGWNQHWKPILGKRGIVFSEGEVLLGPQMPTLFPIHEFSNCCANSTDKLPLPIADLPKVSEIARHLNFYPPAKRK